MKRILSLLLTLALVLGSLSACGEERDVSTPAPSPSVSDAILSPTPANPDVPSPDPWDGPSALTLAEAA